MSHSDSDGEEEAFETETDPLITIFPSRSRSVNRTVNISATVGEREPLLGDSAVPIQSRKKPFYRARPLWIVPFAITASLVRGMTLAPRVEVFTQLSCSRLHPNHYNHTTNTLLETPFYYGSLEPGRPFTAPVEGPWNNDDDDPRQIPSRRCTSDPAVTAGAARIQTMFTTTMGLLSAFTTGWWGHFGERHGRTKVLAMATFGLFLTDLTFILASTPSSPLSAHGHKLLIVAPVIEGLLGGWSTLHSATSAYISDCTSSGSRASVFSRFTGVTFLGFSLGPIIGGWLIRHPIGLFAGAPHPGQSQSVTSVFCVAALGSFVNVCLMLFVYPESVSKEKRDLASGHSKGKGPLRTSEAVAAGTQDTESLVTDRIGTRILRGLLTPLAFFFPVPIYIKGSTRKRRDWSLTLVATAMFGYMLSAGLYQIKYLYGSHVYDWGPEQLSYYISAMGGGRALFLLFLFPLVISVFKPKSQLPKTPGVKAVKPKPTKEHLSREIKFDLRLARISLVIDILANTAIILAPAPLHTQLVQNAAGTTNVDSQFRNSQALFVVASGMASWGAGLVPAIQSLALCIVQARALLEADSQDDAVVVDVGVGAGGLFGALAMLQAIGQMILGPLLFGLVYSGTVATYPKAVFATAIGILFVALAAMLLARSPLGDLKGKAPVRRRRRDAAEEEERGRSRVSKDLGGYGSTSEAGSPPQQGTSSSAISN
ncbi:major facilitator superfamily domain-containing protein [Mycena maculata]|uniref:Major facilitator superfamily domain-containing protein n=1 Tax=Mycena maculata TaxID=230809 RepID=A0AAD7HMM1_9AGAR|nr:major facilitator superfamily domain-containing protein [Mycena maculata]